MLQQDSLVEYGTAAGGYYHYSDNLCAVQQRIQGMQHNFMSKGMTSENALKSGYQSLDYMVSKQAAVLSYMDVFLYLGVLFLVCVPIILMMKGNKAKKIDLAEAMH